ncbi:hypothetical protein LOTGIDRAFT_223842 [Lottia gigantea]|uniref:Protein kinase domain-containing protein n=1 Tax=Lottia gigantea TaxID=225164 RepID=V4BFG9_LOTGI|nr:hypothetical protein LOTGIDRAFT_223842 [Lottia gigantea]ESP04602.1 hypothetical protein LOTGIDRAFT_223842 [Lottia gigantea]
MSSYVTLQTVSVIYNLLIGNGASSMVFKAFDKRTGEQRAAKVIKDRSKYNLLDLNREVTTLKHLNHSNIVKLYGKETEIGTGRDVLILEYCQSSLYSFLQEPENLHGLRDQEFLTLFIDIASGFQYLHSNGIIHRDLKPGNILRKIKPDLSPIYVISDFGTSRRLENPEEEYFSLVGTEEFLHPAVYQKAFIDRQQVTPFNSGTDLWSFGCTLFQAISSRMPFIPFDGARNDRKIM